MRKELAQQDDQLGFGGLLQLGAELCVSVALALLLALGVELTIRLRAYSQWLAYAHMQQV